jgi:hypothetical protein
LQGYSVPIDVNQQAAEIEVHPDRTVITYSHIGFTVRQIMFSPSTGAAGPGDSGTKTGPIVLFQFDCLHPTDFTLRFTPELRWMWPERNEGVPGAEWVAGSGNFVGVATTFCTPTILTWQALSQFQALRLASSLRIRSGRRSILWSSTCTSIRRAIMRGCFRC